MARLVPLAVIAAVVTMVAGCGGHAHQDHPSSSAHTAAVDRGGRTSATLTVASGTTSLTIGVGHLSGRLVTATTPAASGQRPQLTLSGSTATLQLTSAGGNGPAAVDVTLAQGVAWTIDLDGGATEETVDMRGGRLALLDLGSGATRVTVHLPALSGTQQIREEGGASEVTVDVPASVATHVEVDGGAGSVQIGGVTHSGVGGNQTYESSGYATAADRLDLQLRGGVSSVVVGPGAS